MRNDARPALSARTPPRWDQGSRFFTVAIAALVASWTGIVVVLMVADVWDESRALVLFQNHGFVDLVWSNWMQASGEGVVPVVLGRA